MRKMIEFFSLSSLIAAGCLKRAVEVPTAEQSPSYEFACAQFLTDRAWYSGPGDYAWTSDPSSFGVMVDTRACGQNRYEAYLFIDQQLKPMESAWVMFDERLPNGDYTTYDVVEYTFAFDRHPANLEFRVVLKDGATVLGAREFWIDCINDRDDGLCHADMMPERLTKRR